MNTQKKKQAVALLLEYRTEIAAELRSLDQTIQAMTGNETTLSTGSRIPEDSTPAINKDDWPQMTVQEAVLTVLELHPHKIYRASEIRRYLKKRKFPRSDRKTFGSSVATSARRLAQSGKAIKTTVDINGRPVAAFRHRKTDS